MRRSAEVVGAAQAQDLLLDVRWGAALRILWAGLAIDQRRLAVLGIGPLPTVENLSEDTKVAASLWDIATLCGVVQNL